MSALTLDVRVERWPRAVPMRITGYVFDAVEVIVVSLTQDGHTGRGEAAGVYYHGESPASMAEQILAHREQIEAGLSREAAQQLLPPGGARNALDCALWDLTARVVGRPAWQLAGLTEPKPLLTTFTCSAEDPDRMAAAARGFTGARAIKLKLTGDAVDAARVRSVREVCPEVKLCIDANQGFSRESLDRLMPALVECHVALIEQPFPIGREEWLDGYASPIPIAADESLQGLADVPMLVGRFNMANIKLDKCGGLTEGLAIARALRLHGLGVMVGSMGGTSLAMGPAFLVGQLCDVVDLDGAALLKSDRPEPVSYVDGCILASKTLWGYPG